MGRRCDLVLAGDEVRHASHVSLAPLIDLAHHANPGFKAPVVDVADNLNGAFAIVVQATGTGEVLENDHEIWTVPSVVFDVGPDAHRVAGLEVVHEAFAIVISHPGKVSARIDTDVHGYLPKLGNSSCPRAWFRPAPDGTSPFPRSP